jgi:hypothetical protein
MNNIGEKATGISESEYVIRSLNFKLTDLYDEPVFVLFSKREEGGVRGTLVPWFLKVDKSG